MLRSFWAGSASAARARTLESERFFDWATHRRGCEVCGKSPVERCGRGVEIRVLWKNALRELESAVRCELAERERVCDELGGSMGANR